MKSIITKWYKALGFPEEYDADFFSMLDKAELKPCSVSEYTVLEGEDSSLTNLFMILYLCEELSQKYKERGIPEAILMDTLDQIVFWSGVHYGHFGKVGVDEPNWLMNHLSFKLFKLGRLQFCMNGSYRDMEPIGIKQGDPLVEIHIPTGGPLSPEAVDESLGMAKEFIEKYFPEFKYSYFICCSWLLSEQLREMLPENSNMVRFGKKFKLIDHEKTDVILRFVFNWYATRESLDSFPAKSSLHTAIKKRVAEGGDFYSALGYIKKQAD